MTPVYYPIHSQPTPSPEGDGEWFAAAYDTSVLLVEVKGDATEKTNRLELLWKSLAAHNGIQATMDELTRKGLSATEQFALVSWKGKGGREVKAIVRGSITLTVHEDAGVSSVDGTGVSTWVEKQFLGVRTFEVSSGLANESSAIGSATPSLALYSGVVRASKVTVDVDTDAPDRSPLPTPADSSASAATISVLLPEPAAAAAPEPESESEPAPAPEPAPAAASETESETETEPGPEPAAASESPDSDDESSYDYLFGETVFRSVQDAAVHDETAAHDETAVPDDAAQDDAAQDDAAQGDNDNDKNDNDDGDHDGHTIVSADIAKLRASRRGRSQEQPIAAAEPVAPTLYLEMANGSRELLTQPILVGRAPSVSKVSAGQLPRLVTVEGIDQDISRNHAQFAVEGGTVVVTDLHSRNGTTVVLPGRPPQQLRQGEPTSVIVGTVIDLGGGVTFTVGEE